MCFLKKQPEVTFLRPKQWFFECDLESIQYIVILSDISQESRKSVELIFSEIFTGLLRLERTQIGTHFWAVKISKLDFFNVWRHPVTSLKVYADQESLTVWRNTAKSKNFSRLLKFIKRGSNLEIIFKKLYYLIQIYLNQGALSTLQWWKHLIISIFWYFFKKEMRWLIAQKFIKHTILFTLL